MSAAVSRGERDWSLRRTPRGNSVDAGGGPLMIVSLLVIVGLLAIGSHGQIFVWTWVIGLFIWSVAGPVGVVLFGMVLVGWLFVLGAVFG